jgi:hypothetical protein
MINPFTALLIVVYNFALIAGTAYLVVEYNWSMWTFVLTIMFMGNLKSTAKDDNNE